MFSSPEFWVAIAFIMLLAAIGKKAYIQLTGFLDAHIQGIRTQIENAETLLHKAQDMLAEYTHKQHTAIDQSVEIVSSAESQAIELKRSSERELMHQLELREKACLARIAQAEKEARDDLAQQTANEAFKIVQRVLESTDSKKLTDTILKDISHVSIVGK